MQDLISDTLTELKVDVTPDNIEVLRRAFNRSKADDVVHDLRPFTTDLGSSRVVGTDSLGNSVMIPGDMPKVGDLVFYGNKHYYVKSLLSTQEEIIRASAGGGKPAAKGS